jgi:hypothetical protein
MVESRRTEWEKKEKPTSRANVHPGNDSLRSVRQAGSHHWTGEAGELTGVLFSNQRLNPFVQFG